MAKKSYHFLIYIVICAVDQAREITLSADVIGNKEKCRNFLNSKRRVPR